MDKRYIVAIELSGSQTKAIAVSVPQQEAAPIAVPNVECLVTESGNNCVQYGRVQNLLDAGQVVSYVVKKLENSSALRAGQITSAYVALAGRSLGSMPATAELTLPSEMEITDDILTRLHQEATKTVPPDKKVLRVVPRKYVIDNLVHTKPVGALGSKIRGEFTIVTCNPVNRRNLEMVFNDRVNLSIRDFIVTPLALADMLLAEEEKQVGCMLVDIGRNTTTVAIYKDRALQYLATLPLGSYNITHDISMGMSITDERAELAKLNQGDAMYESHDSDEATRINCYVKARLGEIIANVQAQIEYAGFKPADLPAGIVLTGRGSKLPNIQQSIAAQTKLKVRMANNVDALKMIDIDGSPRDYASILAVALAASKISDSRSCVEFPEPKIPQAAPVAEPVSRTASGYVLSGEDADDDTLLVDDDAPAKAKRIKNTDQRGARKSVKSLFSKLGELLGNGSEDNDADLDENFEN